MAKLRYIGLVLLLHPIDEVHVLGLGEHEDARKAHEERTGADEDGSLVVQVEQHGPQGGTRPNAPSSGSQTEDLWSLRPKLGGPVPFAVEGGYLYK